MTELDEFIHGFTRALDAKKTAREQEARAEVERFVGSGAAPFFDDVAHEMAALARMEADTKQRLSLEELYERACWANPDVRAVLLKRAIAEAKATFIADFIRALKESGGAKAKKKRVTKT